MKFLKQLFFLITFFSRTVVTMEQSEPSVKSGKAKELIFTHHAKKRMLERDITKAEVEYVIQNGQLFLDTLNLSARIYSKKIKKNAQPLVVVTKPTYLLDQVLIITLYYSNSLKSFPKKHRFILNKNICKVAA